MILHIDIVLKKNKVVEQALAKLYEKILKWFLLFLQK